MQRDCEINSLNKLFSNGQYILKLLHYMQITDHASSYPLRILKPEKKTKRCCLNIHLSHRRRNRRNAWNQYRSQDGMRWYRQLESIHLHHHGAPHSLGQRKRVPQKQRRVKPWRRYRQEATWASLILQPTCHEPRLELDSVQQQHQAITRDEPWYCQAFWIL